MHENRRWERWKPYILLKWYLMVFVAVNLLIQVLPWNHDRVTGTSWEWSHGIVSVTGLRALRFTWHPSSPPWYLGLGQKRWWNSWKLLETLENRYILFFRDFHVSLFYSIASFLCFLSILIVLHSICITLVCILANFRIAWLPDTTSSCYACPLEFSFLSLHLHGCGALIRMLKGSRGHVEWHIVTS